MIVAAVLAERRARGKTIVVATHDLDRLESDYDDAVHLVEGTVQPDLTSARAFHLDPEAQRGFADD